jgi:hypothetical protein
MSGGRDGRVAVTFAAVPLDELEAFARAVLAYSRDQKG